MKTEIENMQDQWRTYRDKCYPGAPLPADQNRQLHQAFFAGAFCAFTTFTEISALPEDEAMAVMKKLQTEIVGVCDAHAQASKQQQ